MSTYLQILDSLLSSIDGWRHHDGDGTLRFGWIQAPEDQAADHTIGRYDFGPGGYTRNRATGSPPRRIECQYLHIGHVEQPGDLLDGAKASDLNRWKEAHRTVEKKVKGGETLYPLSEPETAVIAARFSTRKGARIEAKRVRDRVKRREGAQLELLGERYLYASFKPGDYASITHDLAPGGTAAAVVWSVARDLGSGKVRAEGWMIEGE